MSKFEKLKADLEKLKKSRKPEMLLGPIEKWMFKELGVSRLPDHGGSKIIYYHPLLEKYREGEGRFTVDRAHGRHKKREMIYRRYFEISLYKPLKDIIQYLEWEAESES